MHNTQFSAAVTAARLAAGQPVSTAALAHLAKVEAQIKQVQAAR
ncbi:hypothetical protein S-CBP42_0034 [Synechococcus phage S-CBP42]|uniref:Uncharacterized protein n=1 Tax=Synechococcus phage S-CBP42 TaxID=461711 RepID=A0A096VKU4_9CAUD|nr:hypothetical protein AVU76_gp34 [Synechococcus phage S-CBP42]AGK86685.1 hypothetical protein S-CBP42_0034 [Synechococcus phage S-CBP42]